MADSTTNAGSMGNQTADQACAGCMPTWPVYLRHSHNTHCHQYAACGSPSRR